jgi:hypothetical protein
MLHVEIVARAMPRPGFEPRITDPKSVVISISPSGLRLYGTPQKRRGDRFRPPLRICTLWLQLRRKAPILALLPPVSITKREALLAEVTDERRVPKRAAEAFHKARLE